MLSKIKNIYREEQFHPGPLGLFINPFYFARKGLKDTILLFSRYITGETLDVGCGSRPYQKLFSGAARYIGLEIASAQGASNKKADVFYDGKVFPFGDSSFDSVIALQVLEHVFTPDIFLRGIHRILKPGGVLLISVPFIWDEHEQPVDYARYSSFGLKALIEEHGFDIIAHRKTVADVRAVFQLYNAYIYKVTLSKNPYLNLLSTFVLIAPFNILGDVLALVTPRNPDFYLDNVIVARRRIPA